jgi:hypothetical protein
VNNPVPDYLYPYVMAATVGTVATVLAGLRKGLRLAQLSPRERGRVLWGGATILAGWLFAALLLSWLGFYRPADSRLPTIQYGVLIPILAGVLLFWRWPALQRTIESIPQQWMVSVQVYRVLGLVFLILHAEGRMPGEFAWPAGAGDVAVGLLAPFVGIAYARGRAGSGAMVRIWNLLGISDLVVALTTGFLTSPSPLQMLALDRPNNLISTFPLVMIPVFLVPLSVLLHLASLEKLRRARTEDVSSKPLAAGGRA